MTLTRLFAIVVAFDVLGLAVSSEPLSDKLLVGTPINAPFTFVAVQALVVAAATRHRAGAAVLTVLCFISVVSGFSDGSFAADLTAAERVIQLGIVVSTAALGVAAARSVIRPRVLAVG
ncbi:MAG TPA: hypothetical protein VFX51_01765 [Solirubrobacteraceae bacterium]|nr:hypothetical protein [Solirubrobacteraceae bacterium]